MKTGLPYQDYVKIHNFLLTYNLMKNNSLAYAVNTLLNIAEMYELIDEDNRERLDKLIDVMYVPMPDNGIGLTNTDEVDQ